MEGNWMPTGLVASRVPHPPVPATLLRQEGTPPMGVGGPSVGLGPHGGAVLLPREVTADLLGPHQYRCCPFTPRSTSLGDKLSLS